jgi:hypothetical protein
MRSTLVNWISNLAQKLTLFEDTIFLAITLLDRYMSSVPNIPVCKFQLVGTCCFQIACKFYEKLTPEVADFVLLCGNSYTNEEFKTMEVKVIKIMNYNIDTPQSVYFFNRFSRQMTLGSILHNIGKYQLELAFLDIKHLQFTNSLLAAGATYSVMRLGLKQSKEEALIHNTGYPREELISVSNYLMGLVKDVDAQSSVYKKYYFNPKYEKVAQRLEYSIKSVINKPVNF